MEERPRCCALSPRALPAPRAAAPRSRISCPVRRVSDARQRRPVSVSPVTRRPLARAESERAQRAGKPCPAPARSGRLRSPVDTHTETTGELECNRASFAGEVTLGSNLQNGRPRCSEPLSESCLRAPVKSCDAVVVPGRRNQRPMRPFVKRKVSM